MKLSEKICYCRKKSGKSQEALAEQLGVSRQAVSKWETGEAGPELKKLRLLAEVFGVSTDWLLSDDEPQEEAESDFWTGQSAKSYPDWIDSIPGTLGRLLRRYGWLLGVYIAVYGAAFTLIGGLARFLSRKMFTLLNDIDSSMFGDFSDGTVIYDEFGNQMGNAVADFASNNPVSIMGTVIMVIGIVAIIGGVILAIVLKKQSRD